MGVTKEEFFKAFDRNNQFIKNEKRRNEIWEKKEKAYIVNNFKSDAIKKTKRNCNKEGLSKSCSVK